MVIRGTDGNGDVDFAVNFYRIRQHLQVIPANTVHIHGSPVYLIFNLFYMFRPCSASLNMAEKAETCRKN
jgi:hypothetical protein